MLCGMCFHMLRGQEGRIWKGTYDLHFNHHRAAKDLRQSAEEKCGICRVLFEELEAKLAQAVDWDKQELSTTASLSVVDHPLQSLYCLDFRLRYNHILFQHAFILQETDSSTPCFRTPRSYDTSSDEVYRLARQWMKKCKCVTEKAAPWYPARLISLEALKSRDYLDIKRLVSIGHRASNELDESKVKLVETDDWDESLMPKKNTRYATLSHCWGESHDDQLKLSPSNIKQLKEGIKLAELPKTFKEAIEFASRLQHVGYIWIDSLCIMQGQEPGTREDWLTQSATMDRVYTESFLNISATAARGSREGLFFERKPEHLFENEVTLNIDGLPGISKSKANRSNERGDGNLRRCTILDGLFWKNYIENAPVNTRGWVLQERLLAPRVLHFCYNQIAWECSEFDAAEGHPKGLPNFQFTQEGVVEESILKGLIPEKDGERIRKFRLQGYEEPDKHLGHELYALELWRRIVEVYARTKITNAEDKLVALSGIARLMASKVGTETEPAQYVAGMWRPLLSSQLLWRVEPIFNTFDSTFKHLSKPPKDKKYRAPSFSWASIDTDEANGLVCGDITDRDLFIKIEDVNITPASSKNEYGLIDSGYIMLRGKLRRARLLEREKGRFCWQLVDRGDLDDEDHTNVYLDCPSRDTPGIFSDNANIYVLPAARGERVAHEESKYLVCLLLQLIKGRTSREGPAFRRIGLTKMSPWGDKKAMHKRAILEVFQSDVDMPHQGYDQETGVHRIMIL